MLREEVFHALHEPAHHGYEATLRSIVQRFWWPHVRGDVSAFVKACEVCDRDRNANPSPPAPLDYLPADQPFGALYIDIVGGQGSLSLGPSPKSILTMIDELNGWAEAVPIADQSAATVARAVYAQWIARYGVPEQLHADRGTQFKSALYAELCTTFGVDKTRNTPYRPKANGRCEGFNRTLVSMLRRTVQQRPYDWESLLAPVLQSYRSTVSEATSFTPYRLAFGREMRLPVDLVTPLPEPPREVRTYSAEFAKNFEWSYKVAREVIGHGHKPAVERYNERVVERAYQPGTLVRVILHARSRNVPSKLDAQYSGLCEVVEVRGALLTLRELDTQRVFTANHDSVRRSTVARPAVPPLPAARAAPLPPVPPVVPPRTFNLRAPPQPATHTGPNPLALQAALLQPRMQAAQQNPAPVPARRCAPEIPDLRDLSPFSPFGSPAVLPQEPMRKRAATRRPCLSVRAIGPQPKSPIAQCTQAARPPSILNLCVRTPPSPVQPVTPTRSQVPFPQPSTTQSASGPQPDLNPVRKKARTAVQIVNAAVHSSTHQPSAPHSVCTPAHKTNPRLARARAFQANSSKPSARVSFCCAVSLRSADAQHHGRYEYLLRTAVCNKSARDSHAPPMNSADVLMTREQNVKGA